LLNSGFGRTAAAIGITAALLVVAGCSGGQSGKPARAAAPPAVSVLSVTSRAHANSVEFIGQTEAYQKVEIRTRVTGFLAEQVFIDGSSVKEGDLLFHIDPAEFDTAMAAAAAGLERQNATLLEADQKLKRTAELTKRGTLSVANLDEATAAKNIARANVAAAEADLARAELNLSYTRILTPIAGRIGKSGVDPGNLIGPDSGVLATVVALDPMRVVFSITEQIYLLVQKADREGNSRAFVPRIRFTNGQIYDQPGTVQFVDNQVDPATGTIRVFADFPNGGGELLPGLFVTVILSDQEPEQQILVPQAAVQLNQTGSFVLVVDGDSRVQIRQVVTGERAGADIVIRQGLSEGDTLVVEGIQKARPGAEVATTPMALPAN